MNDEASEKKHWTNLFFSGRIFSGMEIHVFRPMMTAFRPGPSPIVNLQELSD